MNYCLEIFFKINKKGLFLVGVSRGYVIKKMNEFADSRDVEGAHAEADELLCEFLQGLGYSDVVDAYKAVGKWYA